MKIIKNHEKYIQFFINTKMFSLQFFVIFKCFFKNCWETIKLKLLCAIHADSLDSGIFKYIFHPKFFIFQTFSTIDPKEPVELKRRAYYIRLDKKTNIHQMYLDHPGRSLKPLRQNGDRYPTRKDELVWWKNRYWWMERSIINAGLWNNRRTIDFLKLAIITSLLRHEIYKNGRCFQKVIALRSSWHQISGFNASSQSSGSVRGKSPNLWKFVKNVHWEK